MFHVRKISLNLNKMTDCDKCIPANQKKEVAYIEILYQDDDFIFVNKPYDMLINSDEKDNLYTVHQILTTQILKETKNQTTGLKHGFHFVNRLDYSTGGVMCMSKSKSGAQSAGSLFENRRVKKLYIALLRGHLQNSSINVDVSIGYDIRHLDDNKMMCTDEEFMSQKKNCQTRVELLETGYLGEDRVSRVALIPHTGRRHQLRVHCKHIGHPIVGDYTYSNRTDTQPHRMYLHAYRLILPLPNKKIDVTAPEDFVLPNWKSLKMYNCLDNIFP